MNRVFWRNYWQINSSSTKMSGSLTMFCFSVRVKIKNNQFCLVLLSTYFTVCANICVSYDQVAVLEHVWFEIVFFTRTSTPELFHFACNLIFVFHGRASKSCTVGSRHSWQQHQSIWTPDSISQLSVLLMTVSTLFVKMLCCALPHRFPAWRYFTDDAPPRASFFLSAYWTACWKEGSLATVPLLVQECPQCQFWKVESNCQRTMLSTSFSISRKTETIK